MSKKQQQQKFNINETFNINIYIFIDENGIRGCAYTVGCCKITKSERASDEVAKIKFVVFEIADKNKIELHI